MATQAELRYIVSVQDRDLKQLQRSIRDTNRHLGGITKTNNSTGRSFNQVTRGALAGSGAIRGFGRAVAFASGTFLGAAGLTALIRTAFDEMSQAAKVTAQTNAVIKSTGGVAGVTAKDVERLGTAIMRKTGIDDEQVKAGQNWLLTFKNVRNVLGENNRIFDQATKAAVDLSVAQANARGGTVDIAQASNLLGKALNDPIRGVTALTRVGVTFSDSQKATIKQLVESNRVLEAQKLILREVESQVQGSANAYGNTLPGQIAKAREAFRNLAASALTPLIPQLRQAAEAAAKFFSDPQTQKDLQNLAREVGKFLKDAALLARDLAGAAKTVSDAVGGWRVAFSIVLSGVLATKLLNVARSIVAVGTAVGVAGGAGTLGKVGALRASLLALGKIGPIAIAITVLMNKEKIDEELKRMDKYLRENVPGLGKVGTGKQPTLVPKGTIGPRGALTGLGGAATAVFGAGAATGLASPFAKGTRVRPGGGPSAHGARAMGNWQSDRAMDLHVTPGTPVLAVMGGTVTKVTINSATSGKVYGDQVTIAGTDGNGYFYTHIRAQVRQGSKIKRGAVIGTVSPWAGGDPHLHLGVSPGGADPSGAMGWAAGKLGAFSTPRGATTGAVGAAAPTAGLGRKKPPAVKVPKLPGIKELLPQALRRRLTEAEGTPKSVKDDIKVLQAIEKFLEKALTQTKKNSEKRIEIQQELNQTRAQIASLQKDKTTKKPGTTLKKTKEDLKAAGAAAAAFQQELAASRTFAKDLQSVARSLPRGLTVDVRDMFGRVTDRLSSGDIQTRIAKIQKQLGSVANEDVRAKLQADLDRLRDTIGDALDAVRDEIEKRRGALEDAFSEISERTFDAFDARTSGLLDGIRTRLQGTLDIIETAREALTPAEAALNAFRNQREARESAQRAADAQERVTKAQARMDRLLSVGASPRRMKEVLRELQEAQEELAEVGLDAQGKTLEQRAEIERKAADKEAERKRKAAEDLAAEEEKQLNASRAELRRGLQKRVNDLQRGILAGNYTAEQALGEFNGILSDFGISVEQSGFDIGIAYAAGFMAAFPAFKSSVDAYRDYLLSGTTTPLPPITFVPGRGSRSAQPMAAGGIVRKPTLALLGEAGPEAVIPLSRGQGVGNVHLHVHVGTVIGNTLDGAARELATPMRRELDNWARRNGYSGLRSR